MQHYQDYQHYLLLTELNAEAHADAPAAEVLPDEAPAQGLHDDFDNFGASLNDLFTEALQMLRCLLKDSMMTLKIMEMTLESSSLHPHPQQTPLKKVTMGSLQSQNTAPSVMISFLDVNRRIKSLPKMSMRMLLPMSMRMLLPEKEQENSDKEPGSCCRGE